MDKAKIITTFRSFGFTSLVEPSGFLVSDLVVELKKVERCYSTILR